MGAAGSLAAYGAETRDAEIHDEAERQDGSRYYRNDVRDMRQGIDNYHGQGSEGVDYYHRQGGEGADNYHHQGSQRRHLTGLARISRLETESQKQNIELKEVADQLTQIKVELTDLQAKLKNVSCHHKAWLALVMSFMLLSPPFS